MNTNVLHKTNVMKIFVVAILIVIIWPPAHLAAAFSQIRYRSQEPDAIRRILNVQTHMTCTMYTSPIDREHHIIV